MAEEFACVESTVVDCCLKLKKPNKEERKKEGGGEEGREFGRSAFPSGHLVCNFSFSFFYT